MKTGSMTKTHFTPGKGVLCGRGTWTTQDRTKVDCQRCLDKMPPKVTVSETTITHEQRAEAVCELGMRQAELIPRITEALRTVEREALERAAKQVTSAMGDWEQGILESVIAGDATMADIRLELKRHNSLLKHLLTALSGDSTS